MGVLALHGSNYKAGQLAALERHNLRLNKHYSNREIDGARAKENVILVHTEESLYQAVKKRVEEEVLPFQKRAIRKDANWLTEFVVTVPIEIRKSREESIRYCSAVVDYFGEKIGVDNIVSAVIHMDETTPHMHLDFTPIAEHKLSSKKIMTRQFLLSLHNEIPQYLQKRGFSVDRGIYEPELAHKKSRSIRRYKKDMEKDKVLLGKQIKALEEIKGQLLVGNYKLAKKVVDTVYRREKNRER